MYIFCELILTVEIMIRINGQENRTCLNRAITAEGTKKKLSKKSTTKKGARLIMVLQVLTYSYGIDNSYVNYTRV